MGAEAAGLDSHPDQPHNHAASPLSAVHLHPDPLLPQLGLPAGALQQAPTHLPFSPPPVGLLPLSQKGLQIRAAGDLLAVQVPVPATPAVGSSGRSGGSQVGRGREERVCQKEAATTASREQGSSLDSNPGS